MFDWRELVDMIALLKTGHHKSILILAFALASLLACAAAAARAETAQSPLPAPTGYVNDFAGVIDAGTKQRLENILTNLEGRTKIQVAVVTVRTTGEQDIYDYSLAVARGWGLGLRDEEKNALLLLVAIDDRKYFTQVSRHLEGDLPDGLVGQIQREQLIPLFRQQQYGQAISNTIEAYVATLARKRGFSAEGIDQRKAYQEEAPREPVGRRSSRGISPFALIIIIVVVLLLFSGRGRGGRGGGGGGCLNMLLLGSLLNSGGRRGGWGSSGWGGGGFGGGGGGGGGFGGFGGGGDFGGGGSGGSW
jgi:uncharacterized protein